MKYMLLIYGNDTTWSTMYGPERDRMLQVHADLIKELSGSGELLGYGGLTTADARIVRVADGVPAVTDGPFTEAKEVLAGYYLVECADLERAAGIAARLPEAPYSPIEVRQVMDPQAAG